MTIESEPCLISRRSSRCSRPGTVWIGWEGYLCEQHADAIWSRVEWNDTDNCDQKVKGAEGREYVRADARKKRTIEKRKPVAMGEIYFVLVDGLIKVGWTSKLADRIRAYGPKATLLANYPGTRSDEAALHRQLTPARSHGREWYSDCDITRMYVNQAIEKHGPPRFESIGWTEPKQVVAGKRAMRYR